MDILKSLKLFLPGYEVKFWDKLEVNKENKKVVLPSSFSNAPEDIVLGLAIFVLEKDSIELKRINHSYLDDLEKEQLSKLYKYLEMYQNVKTSFIVDKKWKVKKFFEFLASKIAAKWPLWEFVKNKLLDIDNTVSDINQLAEEYLEFKGAYLQFYCGNCQLNFDELIEESNSYNEHDELQLESMDWPDIWVIWYLDPALRKTYFVETILEKFNPFSQKFVKISTEKQQVLFQTYKQVLSVYFVKWKKWKTYILPLSQDLAVVSYDSSEVEVYQDKYWIYYIRFLKDGRFGLNIWNRKEKLNFFTEEASKLIYSGDKIDLSEFNSWQELKKFIQWKKYSDVSQSAFYKDDVNAYIEALYEAQEMDCLPANVLFVALARSLGYPARLVIGYQTYIKNDKTYISINKWHAWAEVFDNWEWIRVDATPVKTGQQENQNQDLDSIIEQISEKDFKVNAEDFELKDGNAQAELQQLFEKYEGIENPFFKSALDYVLEDAIDIVNYIKKLLNERKQFLTKQKLKWQPKKRKKWQSTGKLRITPDVIERLAVWDPRIFEKKKKIKLQPNEDIDTRLKDISVAVDVSGSMEWLTWNWENGTKLDNAYLSLTLLYVVAKELDINFEVVVLFSNKVIEWKPENILNKLNDYVWGGNKSNTIWIKKAINSIADSQRWMVFVISDGDEANRIKFFDKESKKILSDNKNLFIVWYGIWEDATKKLLDKMKAGKIPTVIEYRMQEAWLPERSKWFNVKEYWNLVEQLKKHLEQFMISSNIKL